MRLNPVSRSGPTQGTIFTCAFSERYPNANVRGIVITARCDLAQEKVDVHNYVAVIPLTDWLRDEFVDIVMRRELSSVRSEFTKILSEAGHSNSILDSQAPSAVLERVLAPDTTKEGRARAKRFDKTTGKYEFLKSLVTPISDERLLELSSFCSGQCKSVLQELVVQRLSGFYYLSNLDRTQPNSEPGVARLREVISIPADVMALVQKGLSQDEFEELSISRPNLKSKLSYSVSDFAEPIGTLRSPDVEHFIQQFSSLFGRIGVEDHPSDTSATLVTTFLGVKR